MLYQWENARKFARGVINFWGDEEAESSSSFLLINIWYYDRNKKIFIW